ncbi:porin [Paucibacter sp. TC2R-5]|uniref:porin n=1 Tax=Paucibacter sp. TC2R-5 TaxID=2893555 RepID=UPI0021E4C99F|nr:porin [Paucibacter sp. TC2R-5]MCV2359849.1 porin [Paucibacter sp. TC2R-5]
MRKLHAVKLPKIGSAIALLFAAGSASAIDYSYSGFANVTAGRVFSGGGLNIGYPNPDTWSKCPSCYVADFSHGSVYETSWTLKPESRAGLQGTVNFTSDFSFTGQLMARHAAEKAKLDIEWAFLSYNLSPKFTLQAGRKRLPLFYYSDFQDVSFAYNWVRVPPDVYGWAVVNYNGANITYRDDIAGWAVKSNAYAGQEHSKDNPIGKLERPERQDISWDNMMGIDLELNRDWFTARFSYNKSKQRSVAWLPEGKVQTSPDPAVYGESSPQTFSSAAFNIDLDNWVGRSEFSRVTRTPARGSYRGYMIGGGYRIGNFLPMLTISQLKAFSSGDASKHVETDSNIGVTLRYQLNDSSSLKLQVDRSRWDFLDGTDSYRKLVTVSYDMIF